MHTRASGWRSRRDPEADRGAEKAGKRQQETGWKRPIPREREPIDDKTDRRATGGA